MSRRLASAPSLDCRTSASRRCSTKCARTVRLVCRVGAAADHTQPNSSESTDIAGELDAQIILVDTPRYSAAARAARSASYMRETSAGRRRATATSRCTLSTSMRPTSARRDPGKLTGGARAASAARSRGSRAHPGTGLILAVNKVDFVGQSKNRAPAHNGGVSTALGRYAEIRADLGARQAMEPNELESPRLPAVLPDAAQAALPRGHDTPIAPSGSLASRADPRTAVSGSWVQELPYASAVVRRRSFR